MRLGVSFFFSRRSRAQVHYGAPPPLLPTPSTILLAEIKEDVEEECNKFGKVVTLKIPRPAEDKEVVGLGKVCFNKGCALHAGLASRGKDVCVCVSMC